MDEIDRSKPIFESMVPIKLCIGDKDEKFTSLTVRILSGFKVNPTSRDKLLHIEITDNSDPFFLYTLSVTEEQFHDLKHDQSLLVDFSAFASKFVELLEFTVQSYQSHNEHKFEEETGAHPNFIAVLNTRENPADPILSLVETNRFKHLTHLNLHFRAGNDTAIKGYLASRFTQIQAQRDSQLIKLNKNKASISELHQSVDQLNDEVKQATEKKEQAINKIESQHRVEIADMKSEFTVCMQKQQQKYLSEIRDLNTQNSSNGEALQSKVTELMMENRKLTESKLMIENSNREIQQRLSSLESQLSTAMVDLNTLRGINRKLDTKKFEQEKDITKSLLRIAALEQQLKDKEEVITKMTSLIDGGKSHQGNLEESVALYKSQQAQLAGKLEHSIAEINKGNTIIQKLQSENRNIRAKIRLKSTVVKQQEKLLNERKQAIDDLSRNLEISERNYSNYKLKIQSKDDALEDAKARLVESNQMLQSNQQVIAFLNKELNEVQLGVRPSNSMFSGANGTDSGYNYRSPTLSTANTPSLTNELIHSSTKQVHGVSWSPYTYNNSTIAAPSK